MKKLFILFVLSSLIFSGVAHSQTVGGGGATAWNAIGDAAAPGSIDFVTHQQTITSQLNSAGAMLIMTNTVADLTADVSFIDLKYTDSADANGFFIRGYDNVTNLVFSIGVGGAATFSTVGATTFTGALTGNASTATALAADPGNCAAGQIALGVTAAGVAECTATPSGLTSVGATTFTGALTGTASGNLANAALDDTKGNGDTTFIWSADKVFDQLALKAPVDSPIFTTQITTPLIYGSSADNGDITIEGTSSGTKTTSYVILQPTAGNVGIGTSSPTNILSLGNSQAQKFWIENSATDVVGRALTMSAGGTLTGTSVNDVIGGNLILQSGLGTGTGASTISFMTGTTLGSGKVLQTMSEKMTILGNGWVGIGQTGPTANLYVQTSAPGAFEHGIDLINPTMNAGNELGLFIGRSRNTGNQGQIYFQYSGEGSADNRISIGLYGVDDVLNVMNTNRVGIGSTSPAYKLSVISNTATDGIEISAESPQLYFTDQSGGEQSGGIGFNNGQFDFYNSVARLTIANSGNVGIGTTTPNRKLSIWDGDAGIQNSGTLGSESLTEGNFTATTKWTDANDFHLAGGITTVTLAGGGTGYTALDVLTVVQAGGAGGTIRVDTVDGSGVILTFTVTSGGTSYYVANSLSVTGGTGSAATFNITVISNTQARYVHSTNAGTLTQTSGNLAVAVRANRWYKLVYPVSTVTAGCTAVLTTGVAATQQTLTITAGTQTLYFLSAASPGNFVISVTSTAGGFTLDDLSLKEIQGGDLFVGGGIENTMYFRNGNVGIGTIAPYGILHIKQASGVDLMVTGASGVGEAGSVSLNAINDNNNANIPMELRASRFRFTGPGSTVEIDTSGNVGIGTTVPRYKNTTIGVLSSLVSDDATNYEGLTITPTSGIITLAGVSGGSGSANLNIVLTPKGTGSAKVGSNVIAQGGGSTGATVVPAGTVSLIINGTTYYLLYAAAP